MQQRYCIARAVLAGLIGATSMVFAAAPNPVPERVEALLRQMTLEEKVGQLTQYSGQWQLTGPVSFKGNAEAASWDLAAIERSARIAATEAAAAFTGLLHRWSMWRVTRAGAASWRVRAKTLTSVR